MQMHELTVLGERADKGLWAEKLDVCSFNRRLIIHPYTIGVYSPHFVRFGGFGLTNCRLVIY